MEVGRWCGVAIFTLSLTGCDLPYDSRPSVLVVAVEGLSFESLSCDAEETTERTFEGLRPFCEEAVRFSHAFAPSTMSQASMASLLTGLYPVDHGVHHNGGDFLSAKFRTLAEGALGKGYRTQFVSGGAPIWRKSGLAQGFEVFDDSVEISPGLYYRSAVEVIRIAKNWIDHESAGSPFLSVLYLNDLQFPQITTRTREGEVREKTAAAQVEAVVESVGGLVQWLKSKHRWNSTHVVLVGLNSLFKREGDSEPRALSLKSASVQVSLFIKPARKERDNVIQWAVDRNVSLVDVARTMFQWVGLEAPVGSIAELEPESLVGAVTKSEPLWRANRVILSETAWPDWLEGSGVRIALRIDRFLYINDQRPQIFNTLTDRLEALPLKANDPLWSAYNGQVVALLARLKAQPWHGMQSHWLEQIEVAHEIWHGNQSLRKPSGHEAWAKWELRRALVKKDWREVRRLAQEQGDSVGSFVASRHLGHSGPMPYNACLQLALGISAERHGQPSECDDEKIIALHNWKSAKTDEEKLIALDRFGRLTSIAQMDQDLGRLNYLNELRWDVERALPEGPQILDYVMTLRETRALP